MPSLAASDSPQRLGEYELVEVLGAGGMGEVYLASRSGPEDISQVVALKRMLGHLATEPEFRGMLIDEARIVSRLRHPNVVQLLELGVDEQELFLVMEYVSGQTLHAVMRRLAENGMRLPPAMACFIIAEACAGLHAAHEMGDDDGAPLHVVHRDVSPQNVLITYDGHIKVFDFGVAKAAARITRTQTGQVKGKVAYMSPEQCQRDPVDRRTDVFALGILLHEAVTGHRLFKGDSEVVIARQICDEPIPVPSEVFSGVPGSIDRIAAKALAREPLDRHETAAELRAELLEVARALSPQTGRDELAAQMRALFEDELSSDASRLRRARTSVRPLAAVPAESRRVWPFAAALLLLGAVGLAWTLWPAASEPEPQTVAMAPATIELRLTTEPPGAEVRLDGEPRGTTPLTLALPKTGEELPLVLHKEGFEETRRLVRADVDQRLELVLRRESRPAVVQPPNQEESTITPTPMRSRARMRATQAEPDSAMRDFFYFERPTMEENQ